jgi:hypothetical protein
LKTIGIVGNGTDKFTTEGQAVAKAICIQILTTSLIRGEKPVLVSGHSPVGGIDIWAEEAADWLGIPKDIKAPKVEQWNPPGEYGYKARNLDIAASDVVHVILADIYPDEYTGRKFDYCYHCRAAGVPDTDHVKSGGCWTGHRSKTGNKVFHIVQNYPATLKP